MFRAAKETIRWPNHAKCAVLLTIHVDGESLYNRNPQTPSPRRVSYGKYGPMRAVDRLLELTQRKGGYRAPISFRAKLRSGILRW